MLPDKSKGKVLEATVVAAGPGRVTEVCPALLDFIAHTFYIQHGNTVPLCVKVGDNVFLPEYGGTKVVLEEKVVLGSLNIYLILQEYYLFRESDILAKIQD